MDVVAQTTEILMSFAAAGGAAAAKGAGDQAAKRALDGVAALWSRVSNGRALTSREDVHAAVSDALVQGRVTRDELASMVDELRQGGAVVNGNIQARHVHQGNVYNAPVSFSD